MLPMMITSAVQASVSVKRINTFMRSDELEPGLVKRTPSSPTTTDAKDAPPQDAVRVSNGSFRWEVSAAEAAKPETNGVSSKANGTLTTSTEESKVGEKGDEEEEEKTQLLNGSGVGATSETPREVFSLKDINIR